MEILVVDDELAIRKGLAAILERAGYSVRTARDGIAALGAIRGEGCVPSDGNLRAHVSRLRGKLAGGLTIDGIRGRGYALIDA